MQPVQAPFPATRLRRTRANAGIRALVRENDLQLGDLIWPVFVREGEGVEEPIPSMPGVMRRSVDKLVEAVREAAELGIGAARVFPYTGPEDRTEDCARAGAPPHATNRAIAASKQALPDMVVLTDVALDT